jgi:phospholipid/cholesterol/gamma-HCH transport system substrate-binding protein
MTPNRERVWVGLFVVIAIAVLSGTAIAVWGGMGRNGVPHRTYFKFSGGVQAGTPVRYGGMRVGTVKRVGIDPGDSTRIEVDLVVDEGTPIKTDSVTKLSALGLLSDNYVEITTGSATAGLIAPGAVINSTETAGIAQIGDTIQALVPQIEGALDKLTRNLDSLQVTVERANDLLNDDNRANVGQALARANDLMNDRNRSNLADSLNNFNQLLSESRPKVSAGLTSLNNATSQLLPLLENVKKTSTRADQMLSNIDSMLADNRPDLRVSVSELREVLANSRVLVNELHDVMNQNSTNIYEILENMRASAENIRSLTETIKSRPASLIRGVSVKDRKPGELEK